MKTTPAFWERYFRVYDTLNASPVYRNLLETIADRARVRAGDRVLDAGAGTGNLSLILSSRGARVVALDYSESALRRYREKDPDGKTVFADLEKPLPFPDNTFDAIVSNNTLYNIPRDLRPAVVRECFRILKEGGVIVVSNIHWRYKPISIYLATIRQEISEQGFFRAIKLLSRMLVPTLILFYYNFHIQHAHKVKSDNLFRPGEQASLLRAAGFDVGPTETVFAGQAFLDWGRKPK